MIPELSAEELALAVRGLDEIASDGDDMNSAEWFLFASDRFILQTYAIREAVRAQDWGQAAEGLAMLSSWCGQFAQNAVAQLPADQVLELVRQKLEQRTGQPHSLVGLKDGWAAFKPEEIEVPDRYEEP